MPGRVSTLFQYMCWVPSRSDQSFLQAMVRVWQPRHLWRSITIAYWCFDMAASLCLHPRFFDFHLNVAVVAGRPPIVEPEVDVTVLADELGGLDLDVGERLPAPLLEAQEFFPPGGHGHAPGFFPGQDLQAADALADVVEDAHPVVVAQAALARVVVVHIDDGHAALQPEHGAMVAPGGVDRPAPVRRVPVEWEL